MKIINLGLVDYREAHQFQKNWVQDLYRGTVDESLILCHHPPVVTLGKKASSADLCGWAGDVYEIERGGQATWHGPSQVVIYPIIDLSKRGNDIYLYLRNLEKSICATLSQYQLEAKGDPENTGVWVNQKKIASIGIAVKRWITYHGLALNLYRDPMAFQGMSPCGMNTNIMTNLEDESGISVDRADFESKLCLNLIDALSKSAFSHCQAEASV